MQLLAINRGETKMSDKLTKKQIEEYRQFCRDRDSGRILTPDGIRFICEANEYDAEKIGKHFLEVLPRIYQPKRYGEYL